MQRTEKRRQQVVLVVDDDASSRGGLCELLSDKYLVHEATDGEGALESARELRPDLIILDVYLPNLDGISTYSALLQDPRTQEIPVIFISGQRDDLPVRCLEMGGADFVVKPLDGRELVARVERTLRASQERSLLRELAQTDALTGLANFRALQTQFDQEHKRALRYRYPISVVMLDLDHLKTINDRFGHEAGNRAIVAVAAHLKQSLRETDFAARFGGDEFFVVLPYQTPLEASVFVDRLRATLPALTLVGANDDVFELPLTLSCGVAGHSAHAPKETGEELLRCADLALYQAKRAGRNRSVSFDDEAAQVREQQLA